jgi:hypothetical protein
VVVDATVNHLTHLPTERVRGERLGRKFAEVSVKPRLAMTSSGKPELNTARTPGTNCSTSRTT